MSKWPKPSTSPRRSPIPRVLQNVLRWKPRLPSWLAGVIEGVHDLISQSRRAYSSLKFQLQGNFYPLRYRLSVLRQRVSGPRLCSDCFIDSGLGIEARKIGHVSLRSCRNCHSVTGAKLYDYDIEELARRFFVYGSWIKTEFGGAPALQFNAWRDKSEVRFPSWLENDACLIENALGVGFFHYGPPLWRLGEIMPLAELTEPASQADAAARLVRRFPQRLLPVGSSFYRLRLGIAEGEHSDPSQYDAPPQGVGGQGRLDTPNSPILYGSQDLEICVHECRVTKADECYLATLRTRRDLRLLDLCGDVENDGHTPFESLYLAVQFLFAAEKHAYDVTRAIAVAANNLGFDGVMYPSYFSSLRQDRIPNLALFGRPVTAGSVEVVCINRLMLETAKYTVQLGPCMPRD